MPSNKRNPYVRSWDVPGTNGDNWKVSERQDGTFACNCPKWKFHRGEKIDCHHIDAIKASPQPSLAFRGAVARAIGQSSPVKFRPVVLARVAQVELRGEQLYAPLLDAGDTWGRFTVAYDLQRLGASPQDVKHYQCGLTWEKVKAYIEENGRKRPQWTAEPDAPLQSLGA